MEADYSIELGPTAPALELPWSDPEGKTHYVELHGGSGMTAADLEAIPEAQQYPALWRFLWCANSPQSAWQTVKCDAWAEETEAVQNNDNAGFMHSCYVDLVLAEPSAPLRNSLETHELCAKKLAKLLDTNESFEAYAEIVVRRCYFHPAANPDESEDGYSLTLFLTGQGVTARDAKECWEEVVDLASACLLKVQPGNNSTQERELS